VTVDPAAKEFEMATAPAVLLFTSPAKPPALFVLLLAVVTVTLPVDHDRLTFAAPPVPEVRMAGKAAEGGLWCMNRVAFNNPFLLGLDHIERLLERTSKAETYPPYNIEHIGSDRLRITLAVAGFAADDLSVTVEDNQLVIRGRQNESDDKSYLHRGIASRQFQRSFVLADGMEVTGAALDNGLLHIDLVRPTPTPKVQRIEIKSTGATRPTPLRAANNGGSR